MNILITGAGLIGSNAARHAVDADHQVVLFDLAPNRDYIQKVVGKDKVDVVAADMRDLPALLAALEKYNVDTLVTTAGLIGSRVQENSYTGATNNILGTINILEAARLRKLKRIVYVSTFGVYERGKINDSAVRETHPIGGHNLYATTKVCSEHLVHAYASMANAEQLIAQPQLTAHYLSKVGLLALSRSFAKLIAADGITMNCVSPGFIDSGSAPKEELERMVKFIPAGYVGTVDDAVSAVRFLLSEEARYVNGANLQLSGA